MGYGWSSAAAKEAEAFGKKAIFWSEALIGGLNNRFGPQYLSDNEAADLINVDLSDPTRPQVRSGYTVLGGSAAEAVQGFLTPGPPDLTLKRIAGFAECDPSAQANPQTRYLLVTIPSAGSGRTYRRSDVSTAGIWVECTTAAAAQYDPGTDDCIIRQGNDHLLIVGSAATNVFSFDPTLAAGICLVDGLNVDDIAAVKGSPPRGIVDLKYAFGRWWALTNKNALCYSILQPTAAGVASQWGRTGTFNPTSGCGRILLSPDNGATPKALAVWRGDGITASLICFFETSIEEVQLNSVSSYSDPFTNTILRRVENRYGCGARETVQSVGQDILFLNQYGRLCRISQTVQAGQAGVSPVPVSEKIAGYLPGRLTLSSISKCQAAIFDQRYYLAFPIDGETEPRAVAVYNLAYGYWEGVSILDKPVGRFCISNIRATVEDLWFSNGDTGTAQNAKTFRFDPTTYLDDTTPYQFTEWTKALIYGSPECDKLFSALEAGFIGDAGVIIRVYAQIGEDGRQVLLNPDYTIPDTQLSDFPLLPGDFPLLPGDFPLLDGPGGGVVRNLWRLDNLLGGQRGLGRMIRFGFTFSTLGNLWAQRAEWWATAFPTPAPAME